MKLAGRVAVISGGAPVRSAARPRVCWRTRVRASRSSIMKSRPAKAWPPRAACTTARNARSPSPAPAPAPACVPAHSLPAPILQGGGEQFASRLDALQPGAVFNRQRQGIAQPQQVIVPVFLGDLAQGLECGRAVLRFEPGLEGERWKAQIRAGHGFPRAQGLHARIGAPRAFASAGCSVDHQDVVDAFLQEHGSNRQATLAGTDDKHIEHRLAIDLARRHPGKLGVLEQLEFGPHPLFEGVKAAAGAWCKVLHRSSSDSFRVWPATLAGYRAGGNKRQDAYHLAVLRKIVLSMIMHRRRDCR